MSNLVKQKTYFYTIFKNIPYTDEEWERETARFSMHQNGTGSEKYKERHRPRDKRPNHPFRWGDTGHSHEEARAICERALKAGAQCVGYSVGFTGERWVCGRDFNWKKLDRVGRRTRW